MTPPNTNPEKEKRRHRPVLYLVVLAIVIIVIGGLFYSRSPIVSETGIEDAPTVEN